MSRSAALLVAALFIVSASEATAQEAGGSVGVDVSVQVGAAAEAPTLETYAAALSSPAPADRVTAVRGLTALRAPLSTPHLVRVLRHDPAAEVRGWAARGLIELGAAEGRAAVTVAAQRDPDQRVRALAVQLVGPVAAPVAAPAPAPAPAPVVVQSTPTAVVAPPPMAPRARRQRPPGRGFVIGGWSTFASTYGLGVLGTLIATTVDPSSDNPGYWLLLPVFGPVAMGFAMEDTPAGIHIMLWLWTAAQATGMGLLVAGHVRRARWRREQESGGVSVALVPAGPGDLPGLTAVGRF